jgi:hypothetical protein
MMLTRNQGNAPGDARKSCKTAKLKNKVIPPPCGYVKPIINYNYGN